MDGYFKLHLLSPLLNNRIDSNARNFDVPFTFACEYGLFSRWGNLYFYFFVIVLTSDRVICSKIVHNLIVRLKNVNFFEYFKTRLEAITWRSRIIVLYCTVISDEILNWRKYIEKNKFEKSDEKRFRREGQPPGVGLLAWVYGDKDEHIYTHTHTLQEKFFALK